MKRRIIVGAALWAAFALERPLSLSPYTAWLLGVPLVLYCASHFHAGLWRGLQDRRVGLFMLASTSAWAMFLLSTAAVFLGDYLPPALREHRLGSLAAMLTLVNLGLWLEARYQKKSPQTLSRLSGRMPTMARVVRDASEAVVPIDALKPGDVVVVRPGEPVPVDGEIVEGETLLDESLRTGVLEPVEKVRGSRVYGGAVNKRGRILVAVPDLEQALTLRRVLDVVRDSASERQASGRAVDPVARAFFAAILLAAAAAALIGAFKGPHPRSLYAAAAFFSVLCSACPWGVGLATPLAVFFGGRRAGAAGVGLRNPRLLESFQKPDALLIDKTGVLTEGRPEVAGMRTFGGCSPEEALRLMLAAESGVSHPVVSALRAYAAALGGAPLARRAFEVFPGRGVSASVGERRVLVGSLPWLAHHGIEPDPADALHLKGRTETLVGLAAEGRLLAVALLCDRLRPDIRETIDRVQAAGIEPILISGDANAAVFRAAEQSGISKVYAEALEDERASLAARLRAKGRRVAVLGEGLRDCAALSAADIGLCTAGGGALAEAVADFTLERRDLGAFLETIKLAQEIRAAIRRNFIWMFAVHALLIPLSVGSLYLGIRLGPLVLGAMAAAALAAVLVNSARLAPRPFWRFPT
ncbi:MAG TPA: hypothetical protein DCM05_15095 [Elusimicrobia bacterium]|nr:hypothetical protein [Elusimicrobiota bacterium]